MRYAPALEMADHTVTYRLIVKEVAAKHGVYATFMPKPIFGENGSGMHTHQSLFKDGRNAFFDTEDEWHLSEVGKAFIAGQLRHAREISAVFAQWVNSYKRLVPGYEAPVYVAWSRRNRSALIRIPLYKPGAEQATRAEIRCPDPACNPYLTFAALLQAGLEGIEKGYELPAPMETNLYHLTSEERRDQGIVSLPGDARRGDRRAVALRARAQGVRRPHLRQLREAEALRVGRLPRPAHGRGRSSATWPPCRRGRFAGAFVEASSFGQLAMSGLANWPSAVTDAPPIAFLATTDAERARLFYAGVLGVRLVLGRPVRAGLRPRGDDAAARPGRGVHAAAVHRARLAGGRTSTRRSVGSPGSAWRSSASTGSSRTSTAPGRRRAARGSPGSRIRTATCSRSPSIPRYHERREPGSQPPCWPPPLLPARRLLPPHGPCREAARASRRRRDTQAPGEGDSIESPFCFFQPREERPMDVPEIRSRFLRFYAERGHAVIPAAPIVPAGDASTLFITAGMQPLVPFFLGERHPAGRRVVDVQPCVRTDDIDEVGDPSHLTFLEMLGRWSLGDYDGERAVELTFDLLTGPDGLGLDPQRLYVSVFAGDGDAPRDRDVEAALDRRCSPPPASTPGAGSSPTASRPTGGARSATRGPCGPDSELFVDTGAPHDEAFGPDCHPACPCDRLVEIGNDVFLRYDRQPDGGFLPLGQRSVDTGMGLERLAQVLLGLPSVYETGAFRPLIDGSSSAPGRPIRERAAPLPDRRRPPQGGGRSSPGRASPRATSGRATSCAGWSVARFATAGCSSSPAGSRRSSAGA